MLAAALLLLAACLLLLLLALLVILPVLTRASTAAHAGLGRVGLLLKEMSGLVGCGERIAEAVTGRVGGQGGCLTTAALRAGCRIHRGIHLTQRIVQREAVATGGRTGTALLQHGWRGHAAAAPTTELLGRRGGQGGGHTEIRAEFIRCTIREGHFRRHTRRCRVSITATTTLAPLLFTRVMLHHVFY